MQPYQRASEAIRSGNEQPLNLLKNAGLTAIGGGAAAAGSKAFSRILPAVGAMISKYVPDNISKAGLAKIDPRLGEFIKGAESEGYNYDEVRQNLREKIEQSQQSQKPPQQKNLIEQEDPELHTYLSDYIKKGIPILKAGKQALSHPRFKQAIDRLTKAHKTSWDDILQSIYGTEQAPKQQKQVQSSPEQVNSQPPQQQQGGLDPVVMKILQQGEQLLQKFKGPQQ